MKTIFLCDSTDNINRVYSKKVIEQLIEKADLCAEIFNKENILSRSEKFKNTEFIFSTWGMPELSEDEIKRIFPSLRCVFYAAGTVQSFARPFLKSGVKVFSAWAANAVPVAEYTVAQIILANKGFFNLSRQQSIGQSEAARKAAKNYHGSFGAKVGIIGAGMIGSLVIKMLGAYKLELLVFDPFLPEDKARELGVKKAELKELFSECITVSNHLANNANTIGMLNYDCFKEMKPYATFINTGRGTQVVEDDLVKILTERPDITALLDVTDPEPPEEGHPFYSLENCILTPHIAGSSGDEVCRMAEYMLDEYICFEQGAPNPYEVTEKMLETMA